MAYSRVTYIGDGNTAIFTIPFEYLKKSFVKVVVAEEPVASDTIEWLSNSSIKLAAPPSSGSTIYIYRDTEKTAPVTGYRDGSVLTGSDLDNQTRQLLHIAQETQDVADEQMRLDNHDRKYDAQNHAIKNVGDPVDDTDAVTYRAWKQSIQPAIDASLAQATTKAAQAEASAVNANSSALLASGQATISGQHAREAEASAGSAEQSAVEAKASADEAKASLPENFLGRLESLESSHVEGEQKNTQQDARLASMENGVTAVSTTLIGSIQTLLCTDSYVPNGCVPANGGEYTRTQFPSLYDNYLAGGKLLTCTYAAWATQVGLTGNCGKFALDTVNQKFKVPLIKDGDSITQAASVAELGKSVKAGLPNATGISGMCAVDLKSVPATGVYKTEVKLSDNTGYVAVGDSNTAISYIPEIDLSRSNVIYGNSTTVTDEQVRLRHFVVVASAQNNASVFDWSNYMAGLAGKLNVDFSNADFSKYSAILQIVPYETGALATCSTSIPVDDTIPQRTEGTQVLAATITPKSATSRLRIDVCVHVGLSSTASWVAALFQGSTANAIAAMTGVQQGTWSDRIVFSHVIASPGIAPVTFSVRIGSPAATLYLNGTGAARLMGGVMSSSIIITEIAA